jgi:ADP-heptose:LPS heptosyltransferase
MKNKYIFFRTDRIGDFLLSAVLIKSIKRSDKDSFITIIASKQN